jgi:hypothetical protein
MPTLYFWDSDGDRWESVDNFLPGDITEAMLASARCPGCECGDADIEYGLRCTHPDVSIVHRSDCAAA